MDGSKLTGWLRNLWKDLPFLISGLAVLALFLSLSALSYVLSVLGLAFLVWMAATGREKPTTRSLRTLKWLSIALTLQLSVMGFRNFNTTWSLSSKLRALAASWGTDISVLLTAAGIIGCLIALYGMNVLSCVLVRLTLKTMKKWLPVSNKRLILARLKRNWYFPVSAVAFFCLNAALIPGYERGLQLAWLAVMVMASQIPSMRRLEKEQSSGLRAFSLLTAVGVCLGDDFSFTSYWGAASILEKLNMMLPMPLSSGMIRYAGMLLTAMGIPFVYLAVLCFWHRMIRLVRETRLFEDIRLGEWLFYAGLIVASLGWMCFCFSRTAAFYGTEYPFDLIYTSDSPRLVQENAYMWLTETENDLRQPLFAVFASPFVGLPGLIGMLTGNESVRAMLFNGTQILMMYMGHFMLARLLGLDARKRICFIGLISCSYTHLLFMLMMEQYIVSYFWLIFCLFLIVKEHPDQPAFWGAGGTLLTSAVILPLMSVHRPWKEFRLWLEDTVRYGLGFLGCLLAFCRFDIFYNLLDSVSFLHGFIDEKVTVADRLFQYTGFIRNCFLAPTAGIALNIQGHESWQLNPMTGINLSGVLILAVVVLSAVWNRRKRGALLSGGWVIFSGVMLWALGWGTMENGLILYSLYFGWAFFALLFQLMEGLEEKTGGRFLIPVLTVCAAAAMLLVNIPGLMEMLRFAIARYPA